MRKKQTPALRSGSSLHLLLPLLVAACGQAPAPSSAPAQGAYQTWSATGTTSPLPQLTGDHHLSDLPYTTATNGWGPLELNTSNGLGKDQDGPPITLGGTTYTRGLGTHASSTITYTLDGSSCHTLTATIGIDDEVGTRGSAIFKVLGDGTEKYASPVMRGGGTPLNISVDIQGVKQLQLVVTDAGDGNYYDRADWAIPTLKCVTIDDSTTTAGLNANYYDDFTLTAPTLTRTDSGVNFDWLDLSPDASIGANTFSARWTGQVLAPVTGPVTFATTSDDGVRLWVNGKLIIDNWTDHAPTTDVATVDLQQGQWYDLQLEYYEQYSGAQMKLEYEASGLTRRVIPLEALRFSTPGTPGPAPAPTASTSEPAPAGLLWSDPATWTTLGQSVPVEGSSVTIPAGQSVVLDVSPPRLANLTVEGALTFAERDLNLQADWIMIHGGRLQVGTEASPFQHKATITLVDFTPGENIMNMGDKFLASMAGGTLELHGTPRLSWTKLARTATAGATSIALTDAPNWQPGDRIVLASTDYSDSQAETATVASVSGNTVGLTAGLENMHYGELQTVAGHTLDERGEVGLLTRNIVIQGDEASVTAGFGGNIMIMDGSEARIENVELTRMGQKMQLRRYPIHFHMLGSAAASYVRDTSLHDLYNRCITIHGTNDLRLQRNVAYNTLGHCFFLEDGVETGNLIEQNLVLGVNRPAEGENLLISDRRFPGASAFWITNPSNFIRGNVAAGGDGVGFWFALPKEPMGLSSPALKPENASIVPRRTPLLEFSGNTAHSQHYNGLFVDNGPSEETGPGEFPFYDPRVNPADPNSERVTAIFDTFTAYKNRNDAVWLRGHNHILRNPVMADNGNGVTFASSASTLQGGIIIGESANLGQTPSWETKGLDGRSLPKPWDPAYPIRGFSFYDGDVHTDGTLFANYVTNSQRFASGLGFFRNNRFPPLTSNSASNLAFSNANRVYIENAQPDKDGDRTAIFLDRTGSVTGTPGRYVAANAPLLYDGTCTYNSAWNSHVCDKPYFTLALEEVKASSISNLTVRRVSDGASDSFVGMGGPSKYKFPTLWLNGSYALSYAAGTPAYLRARVKDRNPGDTVYLRLPYTSDPYIYRDWWIDNSNRLKKVSVSQLASTTGDSYAWDGTTLYLKLVVKDTKTSAALDICLTDLCK